MGEALVLLVEDDVSMCDQIASYLERHGLSVLKAHHAEEMRSLLAGHSVDLLLLDIMLPGTDGLTLCKELRTQTQLPIVFISALGEEADVVLGLELGADDYVVKPFSLRELLARIKTLLRRTVGISIGGDEKSQAQAFAFGVWRLDLRTRLLLDAQNRAVNLSHAEYRLLRIFLDHPLEVLSREFLSESLGISATFDHNLDVHISRLRSRLGDTGRTQNYIRTARNAGYLFAQDVIAQDTFPEGKAGTPA